jgi:chaperonin GroEL
MNGKFPSFAKRINHGADSRESILKGVNILADLVESTLGPGGRFICIHRPMSKPFLTKDGVTVAREVFLQDEFEDAGAQMVKDVASKTCNEAGDGTTTATLLARTIYSEGLKATRAGANPVILKKGMDFAVSHALVALKNLSHQVTDEEVVKIATISANGDGFIGGLVSKAVLKVGTDGVVVVGKSHSSETKLEMVDGCRFWQGWINPYFITNAERQEALLDNPYILIFDKKLVALQPMLPFFEKIAKQKRSVLIIAENIEGEALSILVNNRQALQTVPVKAPGYAVDRSTQLEDIAILTGATVITDALGLRLEEIGFEHLGNATSVTVGKEFTTIIEGAGSPAKIQARISELRSAVDMEQDQGTKEKLQDRLSKMSGGLAIIRVGGASELEVEERCYRVEDAMHATRAAIEEGIVPGGGVALLRVALTLEPKELWEGKHKDFMAGLRIVQDAMLMPIQKIASNAGFDPLEVLSKVRSFTAHPNSGFNALTGEYGDLKDQGIIDPAKVVRSALSNAESIASLMLVTEGMIVHPMGE